MTNHAEVKPAQALFPVAFPSFRFRFSIASRFAFSFSSCRKD